MSHIVSIKTEIKDAAAVTAACHRLRLGEPKHGTAQMYGGQTIEGLLVQLPGWKYPIAIDTASGEIKQNHFEGYWGDPAQLDKFIQAYAVEKAKAEARTRGYAVSEQAIQDGSIKLHIVTG